MPDCGRRRGCQRAGMSPQLWSGLGLGIRGTTDRPVESLDEASVGDFMHEPLARAAQLMAEHGSSHLVVVAAGRRRPVGVISTLDVARCLALAAGASP